MRHRLLSACRPSSSDAVLARRAADGDADAFDKLYVRYQPRLEAYCRSIVRHDEDARDAVQNAMTKALVALRRDSEPFNVQGWLFRIAHNEAISLIRRRRPTSELVDVVHDGRPGPARDLLLREELRATLDGVRALPHNLQHPLLLRELAGLSYGQVAEVVGGTPAAARKAVFDARTALSADRAGRDEACSVIRQSLSEGDGRRRRARVVRSHLQSCQSCCAWESEQRQRRLHLAALLPASAAGSAGGWLAGLFGGGPTVAAGVSGSLAANAKVAASLAVIAAGAAPVVERVEHANHAPRASASATATQRSARRAVTAAAATRAARTGRAGASAATRPRAAASDSAVARRAAGAGTGVAHDRADASSVQRDRASAPRPSAARDTFSERPRTTADVTRAMENTGGGDPRSVDAGAIGPRAPRPAAASARTPIPSSATQPTATMAAQPRRSGPSGGERRYRTTSAAAHAP